MIELRRYQSTCVERVVEAWQQQPRGGKALIVLPTGGGKTIVFTEIARRLGLSTLIIAHRQELLQQAADKFRLVDPLVAIGQVGAGKHEYGYQFTVASVQTISRPEHLRTLQRFHYGLVIIDECHHSAASGYQAVLDALPEAFVLGVTATPDRMDGASIEAIFGEPLFSTSIVDMVEQGHLCDLRALAVRTSTSLDGLHTHNGDFKAEELEELIDTPDRNGRVVKAYLQHCAGRPALCFAVTIAHATHLAEAFNALGVRAAVVSGDTAPEERKRVLQAYERGALTVLCNVGVLTEGFDAPQTSCVILARPTKSRALFTQCVGRGTRIAPGKQDCVILDITDNCLKHRLQPLTLGTVLEKDLGDGESITEARVRRAREAEESTQRERTLKVMQRSQDLAINLLARMDWMRSADGSYTLEVGEKKHRILLVPSETHAGHYSVWAHLAPDFQAQQWLKEVPLDWAQQHAETKARLLQSGEKKLILVDSNAAWRAWPVSDKQLFQLRKFDIPFTDTLTRGEASDLIGRAMAERDRLKAEKKATKGTRTKKAKVSA